MTYKELYEKAAAMLDRGEITLGDFNKMVKPLDVEIHPEPHWIPVTERLPERGKDVLVTRDYDGREDCNKSCRYVEIASCYGEDDDPDWTSFSDEYKMHPKNHHVIAWRELPEPYKGVTE